MNADLGTLSIAALTIGFLHTLLGPDHYLPFVAMSRIGRWSLARTIVITMLCGIGHVGSSVLLGAVGIAFGVVVLKLQTIEALRGDLAGWLLIAFGLTYFSWGTVRAIRNRPHTHLHGHADGTVHTHEHTHHGEHLHPHPGGLVQKNPYASPQSSSVQSAGKVTPATMTPWILFTIFLFGPCEPLIPMVMYPAAHGDAWGVALVTGLFGVATLATMTAVVAAMCLGLGAVRLARLERFGHALAGLIILSCGMAIKLGL